VKLLHDHQAVSIRIELRVKRELFSRPQTFLVPNPGYSFKCVELIAAVVHRGAYNDCNSVSVQELLWL
jgi:hypothetical protein